MDLGLCDLARSLLLVLPLLILLASINFLVIFSATAVLATISHQLISLKLGQSY